MRTIAPIVFLVSYLSKVVTSNEDLTDTPCRARAWVRAPDLEPGQVVQGHVKVKLDGVCDSVSSYSLGLRFAERSWVKTPREGATIPLSPYEAGLAGKAWRSPKTNRSEDSIYNTNNIGWHSWTTPEVNESAWDQYHSDIKNPDLWLVREEERIGFETRYSLVGTNPDPSHHIIQPFALLVPSTAYPPAFDMSASSSSSNDKNAAGSEHIYKYFVDVTFSNGTHREVEAGYTSFNAAPGPVTEAVSGSGEGRTSFKAGRESVNVTATIISGKPSGSNDSNDDTVPRDTFTLEITFPDGRRFEQGSIHNITIISHQLGPGLQRPLSITYAFTSVEQRHHWAAKHAADNKSASELLTCGDRYNYELQPKADDNYYPRDLLNGWENLPRFSQDGVVQNGTVFSTKPVVLQFQVPHRAYPPFDMYYQTSEVQLLLNLQVRNVSDEGITSNLPDDDEYDWVPAMRQNNYRETELLRVDIPIAVHRKAEHHATPVSHVVHYLSPEARAPFFVDPSSLAQLMQITVEERNSLAPFAKAKFSSKVDGDVVKQRYYGSFFEQMKHHYVGNTWLRKVVVPGKDTHTTDEGGALVIQS